ncbi:MAG: acyloxyacyl hydrolase [Paludibacteraceae bacterium]|nr:acyloxyacyl hydrolase [Paludibacteraceae bacterium]
MKKHLLYILLLFCTALQAADFAPYKIKGQFIGGWIYPHDASIIKPLTKGPVLGGEIAFELASDGSKQWQKDFNMPDLGFALQVLDLGNPEITGQMISLYPYINIPMVNSEKIRFNAKMGMGAAFATKPCDLEAAIADPRAIKQKAADYNFAIGGVFNFAISAGLNIEVPVHKNVSLTADVMFNHISSASTSQPNAGLNMFNGYLGVKYLINELGISVQTSGEPSSLELSRVQPEITSEVSNYKSEELPIKGASLGRQVSEEQSDGDACKWSGEVILSGGFKKLYYKDSKYFGTASLNIEGYYHTCRQHRIGVGLDLFYDGAYAQTVAQDASGKYYWTDENTYFGRTFTPNNNFENKLRLGLNIANELTIGKFGIFAHFGIYLYDPVKNMEPGGEILQALNKGETPKKKGVFYPYDINKEDGWNYFRIGVKYHFTKHFLVNLSFKTHLQKVEFFELGVGYAF